MKIITKEHVEQINQEIHDHLDGSLMAMRLFLKDHGTVDPDFRAYAVFLEDGTSQMFSVPEMNEFASDKERERTILMTLHFWVVRDNLGNIFECCELCENRCVT